MFDDVKRRGELFLVWRVFCLSIASTKFNSPVAVLSHIIHGFGYLFTFALFIYRPGRKRDFSPLPWSQYFETMEDIVVENENGKDISLTAVPVCKRKLSMNDTHFGSKSSDLTPDIIVLYD